jgi:polyketide cyclase/dehydrase/lipid transport protein
MSVHMTRYRVGSSGTIGAPPSRVYAVIADYRQHHPRIVPPEYFRKLEVVAGGVGAGTRTRVQMRLLGTSREFEHVITEPEPGRVLVESDVDGSNATTFTVDPGDSSESTHLTITTELVARPGISGVLERLLSSLMLRRVYRKEIARLAEYVAQQRVG